MLKGFIIFLMATFWLVSWSRAELQGRRVSNGVDTQLSQRSTRHGEVDNIPHEAESAHANRLQVRVSRKTSKSAVSRREKQEGQKERKHAMSPNSAKSNSGGRRSYRDVISNVVPNIWVRMNSAMASVAAGFPSRGMGSNPMERKRLGTEEVFRERREASPVRLHKKSASRGRAQEVRAQERDEGDVDGAERS